MKDCANCGVNDFTRPRFFQRRFSSKCKNCKQEVKWDSFDLRKEKAEQFWGEKTEQLGFTFEKIPKSHCFKCYGSEFDFNNGEATCRECNNQFFYGEKRKEWLKTQPKKEVPPDMVVRHKFTGHLRAVRRDTCYLSSDVYEIVS